MNWLQAAACLLPADEMVGRAGLPSYKELALSKAKGDKLTLATVFAPPLTLPNKAASRFDLWWAVLDFLRFTQDKLTPATVFAPPLTRPNTAALRLVNWWAVLDSNQRLSA